MVQVLPATMWETQIEEFPTLSIHKDSLALPFIPAFSRIRLVPYGIWEKSTEHFESSVYIVTVWL